MKFIFQLVLLWIFKKSKVKFKLLKWFASIHQLLKYSVYEAKLHLVVRFQILNFEECGVTSSLPLLGPRVVVSVKVELIYWKFLVLDRNIWNEITVCRQTIINNNNCI